ncbi:MAG: hypothetical protein ACFFDJ_03020 [Candidatus Odinarchaeota archaeon]
MQGKTKKKRKPKEYKDFITYEPELVIFLKKDEMDLAEENLKIIKALREKMMTVKELHDLYFDNASKTHKYTIKTIYKYLEKLEKAGLITVAGHRITEGGRIPERVYSRTAKVFLREYDELESQWWDTDESRAFSEKVKIAISDLLHCSEPDANTFHDLFKELLKNVYKTERTLLKKAKQSEKLAKLFSTIEFEEIYKLTIYIDIFTTLVQHPELLVQMRKAFDIK